jgi:DNA-directed RNA polymerase specialized sigma24 family protein
LDAWEEFALRFDALLLNTVERTLLRFGYGSAGETFVEKEVSKIHLTLVTRLKEKDLLEECENLSGFRSWLRTVAANQAITHLRRLANRKNLPTLVSETTMDSLQREWGEDGVMTLGDLVPDDGAEHDEIQIHLKLLAVTQAVLDEIACEKNRIQAWILRLSIVAILPLEPEEIDELVRFSPLPESGVRDAVPQIANEMATKDRKRKAALGRAVGLWYTLRSLEAELRDVRRDPASFSGNHAEELEERISEKEARRNQLLADGMRIPRPSHEQIANLVGMPANQVSVNLGRVREKIRARTIKRLKLETIP